MKQQQGKPYDKNLIAKMAIDPLHLLCINDNYRSFICSQLDAAGA